MSLFAKPHEVSIVVVVLWGDSQRFVLLACKVIMHKLRGGVQVNLCQKLFFLQNMGRTCCVQKLF